MRKVPTIAVAIALGTLATSAQAQFSSRAPFARSSVGLPPAGPCGTKDDGSTENALGLTAGGELGWIKIVTCGLATHDSVATAYGSLMFPGSVTNGNQSEIVVYTNSANPASVNPNDAGWTVQTKVSTTVTNGDTDILNKVTYASRNSTGNVMVLASADQVAGQFPAPLDQAIANPDAWIVGNTAGPGSLNTTTLSANNVPPTNMSAIGFPSTFLLRIESTGGGCPPPTTTTDIQHDDGSTEAGVGLATGGEIGWLQRFDAGGTTITGVKTAYGTATMPGSVTNGRASRIAIYEETYSDFDPRTGLDLLESVTTVITNGSTDILNLTMLPTPLLRAAGTSSTWAMSTGDHDPGQLPGPRDADSPTPDAWVVGDSGGNGSMDIEKLDNNSLPPMQMTLPTAWLLRLEVNIGVGPGCAGTQTCFGATACPCGNNSTSGGCANGAPMPAGQGAILTASGSNSIAVDDMVLTVNFTTNQPGLFFQGDVTINGGNGVAFGDGLRCCGTNVIRLEIVDPPGPNGPNTAQTSQPIVGTSPPGTIQAGVKQCYQWWYRNPNRSLCGANFNLSNAVTVTWTP